jgi:hypothetical protein
MAEQSFKNHTQIVYRYYLFTAVPILVLIGIGLRKVLYGERSFGLILLLTGWILMTLFFRARSFALKAQDGAIRSEENLRHFVLTGQLLDQRLGMSQIIALRFASDEELPVLAKRAAAENLSNMEIKQSIQHWRADTYRV